MYGSDTRERRRAAGLTARQVASATGTSETNVAAYERGDKRSNVATESWLLAACEAGAGSPIFVNRMLTVPGLAQT